MPAVVRTLLPLVQQLQSCGPQRLEAAAAAAAGSAYQQGGADMLQSTFMKMQQTVALMLFRLDPEDKDITGELPLEADVAQQVQGLLNDPAVVELLLQDLITVTHVLHSVQMMRHHEAYLQTQQKLQQQQLQEQQQHRHAPVGHSNSSATTTVSSAAGSSNGKKLQQQQQQPVHPEKQLLPADMLPIPAFHRDLVHLLPTGQGYLDGEVVDSAGKFEVCKLHAEGCCYAMYRYLLCSFGKPGRHSKMHCCP
jgi:hypothetical protein